MRTNITTFWVLFVFFVLAAAGYTVWSLLETGYVEWVGTVAMLLSGILAAFIAFYLGLVSRSNGGQSLPEDLDSADIDDGDPEQGHFSPWSWWPFLLAGCLALTFLGLAVGTWLSFIGVPLVIIALVGWVYEYYRGNFAR